PLIVCGADEHDAARGCDRPSHVDTSRIFLSFGKFIRDAQCDLPRNIAGVRIDCRQLSPRRFLAWPALFTQNLTLCVDFPVPEFRCDGISPHARTIVWNTRTIGPLLDPSKTAVVQRIDENVSD